MPAQLDTRYIFLSVSKDWWMIVRKSIHPKLFNKLGYQSRNAISSFQIMFEFVSSKQPKGWLCINYYFHNWTCTNQAIEFIVGWQTSVNIENRHFFFTFPRYVQTRGLLNYLTTHIKSCSLRHALTPLGSKFTTKTFLLLRV